MEVGRRRQAGTAMPSIKKDAFIKAVIFDLDGTLLDTEVLSDRAMFDAFGQSLPMEAREKLRRDGDRLPWEIKSKILGLRGSEWIPMVLQYAVDHWDVALKSFDDNDSEEEKKSQPQLPSAPGVDEFWHLWETRLNQLCEDVEECTGATDLVEELARIGIPLAIATSSRLASVEKKRIKHQRMFQCIPTIVTGDDPAVRKGKPAPDIYLEAARRLGVQPSECLVFEDALTGAQSGEAAGCHVIAVPDPRMDRQVFKDVADEVVDNLNHFSGERWGIELNAKGGK